MTTGSSSRTPAEPDAPRPAARAPERGATLIEVMVSLALVIIGLLGIYAAYTSSVRATSHGRRISTATAKAERQLEVLRNAPTNALKCLAACGVPSDCTGTCAAACAGPCCQGLPDGGVGCAYASDGGVSTPLCRLVPPPETDPAGVVYTYCDPTVQTDLSLPFLYQVKVQVRYQMAGEQLQGTDFRSVVLRTSLYKP
jgi:hypothetical protein